MFANDGLAESSSNAASFMADNERVGVRGLRTKHE